ncbi:transposase [bacterium]|nr:transposase [bacterium]
MKRYYQLQSAINTPAATAEKLKYLSFSAHDFIAKVLQHVPDRYQNMRRYAGFYAANVRLRIQRARVETNIPRYQNSL